MKNLSEHIAEIDSDIAAVCTERDALRAELDSLNANPPTCPPDPEVDRLHAIISEAATNAGQAYAGLTQDLKNGGTTQSRVDEINLRVLAVLNCIN